MAEALNKKNDAVRRDRIADFQMSSLKLSSVWHSPNCICVSLVELAVEVVWDYCVNVPELSPHGGPRNRILYNYLGSST